MPAFSAAALRVSELGEASPLIRPPLRLDLLENRPQHRWSAASHMNAEADACLLRTSRKGVRRIAAFATLKLTLAS